MAREVTKHGMSGYRAGCHCEVCRKAKREYMQRWRAGQKARDREAEFAAALAAGTAPEPEPDVDTPAPEPVAAAATLDMTAEPGPLEQAFLDDLAEPDARVAFRRHLVGIGRLNARVLDQIGPLDRLDLVSPVQLRQLEILTRLAILGFAGLDDGKPSPTPTADAAAEMLLEIEKEAAGGAPGR